MKIHQLSLFLENKPSQLTEPCRLLAEAGIDIRTLTLADTDGFGILRLIVSDWEKGLSFFGKPATSSTSRKWWRWKCPTGPGGLAELLGVFEKTDINIEYMYAFTFGRGDTAVMIFRFDNPDAAIERLQSAGMNCGSSSL